jgi:hypothetical protein
MRPCSSFSKLQFGGPVHAHGTVRQNRVCRPVAPFPFARGRLRYQLVPRIWIAGGVQFDSGLPFQFDGDQAGADVYKSKTGAPYQASRRQNSGAGAPNSTATASCTSGPCLALRARTVHSWVLSLLGLFDFDRVGFLKEGTALEGVAVYEQLNFETDTATLTLARSDGVGRHSFRRSGAAVAGQPLGPSCRREAARSIVRSFRVCPAIQPISRRRNGRNLR